MALYILTDLVKNRIISSTVVFGLNLAFHYVEPLFQLPTDFMGPFISLCLFILYVHAHSNFVASLLFIQFVYMFVICSPPNQLPTKFVCLGTKYLKA